MTDKQMLNLLSKKELIDIIISEKNSMLMRHLEIKIQNHYANEIDKILTEQTKCKFSTLEGRKRYSELEAQYRKLDRIHSELCGCESLY